MDQERWRLPGGSACHHACVLSIWHPSGTHVQMAASLRAQQQPSNLLPSQDDITVGVAYLPLWHEDVNKQPEKQCASSSIASARLQAHVAAPTPPPGAATAAPAASPFKMVVGDSDDDNDSDDEDSLLVKFPGAAAAAPPTVTAAAPPAPSPVPAAPPVRTPACPDDSDDSDEARTSLFLPIPSDLSWSPCISSTSHLLPGSHPFITHKISDSQTPK